VEVATLVFAPCGIERSLNINASVRLSRGTSNPSSSSVMRMRSETGDIDQLFHFAFKECPK